MTQFNRDFDRLFPESQRLERVVTLENQLANELLSGDYTNVPLSSLQERLADTESFWTSLQALVIAYNAKPEETQQKVAGLMGVIQGLAYDVALDAAPTVEEKLIDEARLDFAVMMEAS